MHCIFFFARLCQHPEILFDLKESITSENYVTKIERVSGEISEFDSSFYEFSDDVQQTLVSVSEPDKNSERVLRFVAGLVASITFSATLKNFSSLDLPLLRIRVR